jgi:hypothetical protein
MLPQTFDLVDDHWLLGERRRRRLVVGFPIATALVFAGLSLSVWTLLPGLFPFTVELSAGLTIALVLVSLYGFRTDPVRLTISGQSLRFERKSGRSFSIELDRPNASVTLIDASTLRGVVSPRNPALPMFLIGSRQTGWPVPITAEAHAALQRELPKAGLDAEAKVLVPGRSGEGQVTYRRSS